MYVIERTDQGGGFVSVRGSPGSYTQDLRKARTFSRREDAMKERCPGNEVVRHVDELLPEPC